MDLPRFWKSDFRNATLQTVKKTVLIRCRPILSYMYPKTVLTNVANRKFEISFFLALLDYRQQSPWYGVFVRRPASVVRVAIISEPIEQIPFKFQFKVALGRNQGGNGHF